MKTFILSLFVVSPFVLHAQDCKIVVDHDKFTDKTSIKTPLQCSYDICHFIFGKMIDKKDTTYYLYVTTKERYRDYKARGVYLIFDDGEKWIKEEQPVEVSYVAGDTYRYSAYLKLTIDQVQRLRNYKITAARLYRLEIDIKNQDAFICSVNKVLE